MSNKLTALRAYAPRLVRGDPVKRRELLRLLTARTGLHKSEINMVLDEIAAAIIFFNQSGRSLRIQGIGSYTPYLKLDGTIKVAYRPDVDIKYEVNDTRDVSLEILNRENIGKSIEEFIEMWNFEHPDDPITQ
jgi:hypothetical protein